MTAKIVVDQALRLLTHVNAAGAVDENREARYYGVAPGYLTLLQYEVAALQNRPAQGMAVNTLGDSLALDDDTALRLLPAGLAMYFALADRDDAAYNHFSKLYYGELVPSIKPGEVFLTDYYGARCDPTMR